MEENKTTYFPLFVNMKDKSVRVYGAGTIAARRIRILLDFEAKISAIAPEIKDDVSRLEKVKTEKRSFVRGEIENESGTQLPDFVLAATDDPAVNAEICRECRLRSIPVNNASDQEQCDFFFPAVIRDRNLVIGLTSGGQSHSGTKTAAAMIREALRKTAEAENK